MYLKIFISLIIFFFSTISAYSQEYKVVRGIIDVHSNVSDGLYSLERICELAKEKGLEVLIFTDSGLRKWEYGLWPLRNILKKTIEESSVLRLGVGEYLKRFVILKERFPDLVVIPGLEVSPFYYWQGNPLSKNFSLNDYHKRFLIFGLNQKDYQNLPIVGNRGFGYISLSRFNQYQGNQGIKPYQDLIDYVIKKKGLIFWSHPEMTSIERYKGIEVYTPAHPEDLYLSSDYTGFGITYTDRITMTEAGGVWDKILLEYIAGKRKKPVWIIGSLHYDGPSRRIDAVETLFFLKEIKQEEILKALREGRMYVRFKLADKPVVLNEFKVKDEGLRCYRISIKGNQTPSLEPLKIDLIRNGKVFKSFEEAGEDWAISVEDSQKPKEKRAYYRLRISGSGGSLILSNPVFVE